jgi:diguanylate cyclase (GGDEF)-like protein/putative nucleotidyltransferase with HDIG domain
MLDLDGFKDYNDRFGHTNGDAVLKSLGRRLTLSLRKSDTAFRYGGDEFAIVLPETDASKSRKMVDRIRYEWLKAPKSEAPLMEESRLTFSAGIAQFPQNAQTADGLVFLADTALYRSKREGGHKSALVSELGTLASGSVDRETLDHVYALAATVDARDPYTYGHSKRVAAIAEMIGGAARLPPDDLAHLRGAALLHDIGKVGVPDSTLGKPGKLTEDEWEVIRKHCDEGARIVSHVKALEALVPLIRHHHEWYDGSGYPGGLAGERIPVGARIIAIADAYDTMTTRRPYRAPVSREEAIEELRRCSGTQFDAVLVGSFGEALRGAVWEGGMKKKKLSLARR